jgi:hypothetical protein
VKLLGFDEEPVPDYQPNICMENQQARIQLVQQVRDDIRYCLLPSAQHLALLLHDLTWLHQCSVVPSSTKHVCCGHSKTASTLHAMDLQAGLDTLMGAAADVAEHTQSKPRSSQQAQPATQATRQAAW